MTAHHSSAARHGRAGPLAGLLAAAAGELTVSATRRGRSPSSGLARGLVDASPAMLVDGGVALVGRAEAGPGRARRRCQRAGCGGRRHTGRPPAAARRRRGHRPAGLRRLPRAAPRRRLRPGHRRRDRRRKLTAATAVAPLPVRPPAVLAAAAAGAAAVVAADRRARCRGVAALCGRVTAAPAHRHRRPAAVVLGRARLGRRDLSGAPGLPRRRIRTACAGSKGSPCTSAAARPGCRRSGVRPVRPSPG
jgi:hypothetical protein